MTVPNLVGLFDDVASVQGVPGTHTYSVDGCIPGVALRPTDRNAVSTILARASSLKVSVIPWGGGTAMSLGNVPAGEGYDVALDLTRLDQVIEYRPRDLTITVEAGMAIAAVQRVLDEHRQLLALDPWLPDRATIGGTLAANRAGPRRFRYGTARDILIGSAAVLADGTEIKSGGRVVKNVAGYDLNKLLIGSHGTLAVITSATFKLIPAPPVRGMVAAVFSSVEDAHAAAQRVAGSTLSPLTLDLIAPRTARLLSPTLPEGWLFAVEVAGSEAGVERSRQELLDIARAAGCLAAFDLAADEREQLYAGLRDFGFAEAPDGSVQRSDAALLLRAAVLPSQVGQVCRLMTDERAVSGVLARAGNGVVYGCWPESAPEDMSERVTRLRGAIESLGGVLVVERYPPGPKRLGVDVWGIRGPDVDLMRRVKQEFDPAGMLSPGRGPGDPPPHEGGRGRT